MHLQQKQYGLINVGDEIEISEYQSFMNYSYIIEPAVAMSGCYPNAERIRSRKGIVKNIEHTPRGFIVTHIIPSFCVKRIKSSALLCSFTPNNCSAGDLPDSVK